METVYRTIYRGLHARDVSVKWKIGALELVERILVQARGQLRSPELMAEELRLAHKALGSIVGEFTPDDLLGEIFSRFCIGK